MIDLTDKKSIEPDFKPMWKWFRDFKASEVETLILCGNKADCAPQDRQVTPEDIKKI